MSLNIGVRLRFVELPVIVIPGGVPCVGGVPELVPTSQDAHSAARTGKAVAAGHARRQEPRPKLRCRSPCTTPGHHLIESTGRWCDGDRGVSTLPCRYGMPDGAAKTLKGVEPFCRGNAVSAMTKSRRPWPISGPTNEAWARAAAAETSLMSGRKLRIRAA